MTETAPPSSRRKRTTVTSSCRSHRKPRNRFADAGRITRVLVYQQKFGNASGRSQVSRKNWPADRSESGPQALGDVVSRLCALRGYGRPQGEQQLAELWRRIAGEKVASQSRVLGIRNGVLQIGVGSASLLSELASFHRHALLESLQNDQQGCKIRDLKFKLRS
ncbi:MAG: DUF721 domain-containing protein [Planctomycetota bacterium]|nr:MAG: DUF721 domain-containing protein [Planctomycetota bacterium]REJ95722.1 MAG: DUF721 domain-containing protein [Planctomycetota bacterium]REK23406.1 MAG: DUF721 domain-containing protein [Planctomycetota bacterium]REK38957.1 MAG: DUF721 domain-containing protein [Planctomycetota bacterium]